MSRLRPLAALAWRESRFARRRLLLFLSSISLGVAALVATQSFAANLAGGVRDQSRALLGADAAFSSNRKFGKATEAVLDSLRRAGVPVSRVTSFASVALAPRTGGTRLSQVRAVEPGFPYYGEIRTTPAGAWAELGRGRVALVDPALLTALNARVGDEVTLGEARFRIAGTVERVPGESGISTFFAPRVFIPARHLAETRLLRFGSRVEYDAYLRLPAPGAAKALVEGNRARLRGERVRGRTAEEQQAQLDRALGRLGSYLGLVGTFALLLGGIGVASAMGAYMAQKRETVATLRCLGATSRQVIAVYLMQAAAMGVAGAVLGTAMGVGVQWVLPRLMADLLPVRVGTAVDPAAVATGIGVGVWIAVAFALLPLLATRRISPLQALRRRVEDLPGGRDGWTAAAVLLLAASVVLLVVVQAGSLWLGLGFAAGIAATLGGLWATAWLAVRGVRRLRTAGLPYPARQGIANLHRPGNQTRVVVLALGFGVFLLATLYLVQDNLLRPLRPGSATTRANLVFFDVQEDQARGVDDALRAAGVEVLQRAPIVPMRIAEINGRPASRLLARPRQEDEDGPPRGGREGEGAPESWAVRREYRSTFRDTVVASEKMLRGAFWEPGQAKADAQGAFPVSLEQGITKELGVDVGDRITWDVQGVRIRTRVTSVREVDWRRLEPNFFAVFPEEALRGAPQTWVLLAAAPAAATRARAQREVVSRWSNVAAVDLTEIQAAVDEVLGRVATVIRFLAAFSVATGFIVLLGAVLTSRLQRVRESVLLRTLGATRRQVAAIMLSEYVALGTLAGLVGIGLATGAGWALARWVFEMDFAVPVAPLLWLWVGVAALAAAVGLGASREVFRSTPLEMLREE